MIETRELISELELIPEMRLPVLLKLEQEGWVPAILESERVLLNRAGLINVLGSNVLRVSPDYYYSRSSRLNFGEVFFRDDDVYFLVAYDAARNRKPQNSLSGAFLEIGVISCCREGLEERLAAFIQSVELAVQSVAWREEIGRVSIEWHQIYAKQDTVLKIRRSDPHTNFGVAQLSENDIRLSELLVDSGVRELLIELKRAGFVREQDLIKKWSKKEEYDEAMAALKTNGLVNTEFLLECRQTSTPLTRLSDKPRPENNPLDKLICPTCNRKFSQERLAEAYSVSDIGKRLTNKSQWMTIWVTALLTELGVPLDSIWWNLSENGEEVDIVMEYLGHVWIFELKDREFGAGDAHPLNYRQVRFEATRTVVVTTEKVSPDAKRVLNDSQRESSHSRRSLEPLFIEGLSQAKPILTRELSQVCVAHANKIVSSIGATAGINLSSILPSRFGESVEAVQQTMATSSDDELSDDDIPF